VSGELLFKFLAFVATNRLSFVLSSPPTCDHLNNFSSTHRIVDGAYTKSSSQIRLSPKFPRRLSKKNFCDTLNVLFVVVWKRDLSRERSAASCTFKKMCGSTR
jgi:hypothetical protein